MLNAATLTPPPEALKDPAIEQLTPLCRYLGLPGEWERTEKVDVGRFEKNRFKSIDSIYFDQLFPWFSVVSPLPPSNRQGFVPKNFMLMSSCS